jgi:hypothetical protein
MTFILRYPLVEHERYQTDSYFIHYLSQTIVNDDRASWLIHPLSYFGYFPFSYPSGVPFVLAELSDMAGISVEVGILIFNGDWTLFCLAVFVLARNSRARIAVFSTFLSILGAVRGYFVLGRKARTPLVALITSALHPLKAFSREKTVRGGGMRRIWLFRDFGDLVVVFGSPMLGGSYYLCVSPKRRCLSRLIGVACHCNLSRVVRYGPPDGEASGFHLRVNLSFCGHHRIARIPTNRTTHCGIGLSYFVRQISAESLPLAVLIAFVPLLGNPLYISMMIAPYVVILGVRAFSVLSSRYGARPMALLLVLLLASSMILPFWSANRWNGLEFVSGDTVIVDEQTYNDAQYYSVLVGDSYAISNVKSLYLRIAALCEARFLSSGVSVLVNGDLDGDDVRDGISWSSDSFPKNVYRWFTYSEPFNVDQDVRGLMLYGAGYPSAMMVPTETGEYFSSHRSLVVMIDNDANISSGMYGAERSTTDQLARASGGRILAQETPPVGFICVLRQESPPIVRLPSSCHHGPGTYPVDRRLVNFLENLVAISILNLPLVVISTDLLDMVSVSYLR